MAISNIVCRGYASFGGGVNKLPTRGYVSRTVAAVTPVRYLRNLSLVCQRATNLSIVCRRLSHLSPSS